MRTVLFSLAGLAVLAAAGMLWAYARTDTYLGRWFAWRASDVGDVARFPARHVAASSEPRPLPEDLVDPASLTVDYRRGRDDRTGSLSELLAVSDTSAFIALVDGVVALEWYADGYARDAVVTSFSVAKSVTALLVLAALEDGYIGGLHDPLTRYLPELKEVDDGYDQVTIEHLLDMRSGIRFRDHDLPWGDKARVYYEPRLRELVSSLPLTSPPGERFAYNSYNPVILGLVLERAVGKEPAAYFQERFWQPLGAEYDASWSVSREGETLPKMESGINARAVDLAKIGLAVLAAIPEATQRAEETAPTEAPGDAVTTGGSGAAATAMALEPYAVLKSESLEAILGLDPANAVSGVGDGVQYKHGWWIYAPSGSSEHAVAGLGHLGQYLFVYPEQRVVIARFGEGLGGVASWASVFDQVAVALDERFDR